MHRVIVALSCWKLAAASKSSLSFERQMTKDSKMKEVIDKISSKVEV
ncbi:MAG: hypothetical protein NC924_04055 [Candidatus Omnitrophica bacterium]|nr:hypothetical protein [Candidatus Omnitrophota bacterium]